MEGDYTERERHIFGPYDRGDGVPVHGDPLRIYRLLSRSLDGDPNLWLRKLKSESEAERFDALDRVVPAAMDAFALVPFDPVTAQGAQELHAVEVLRDFSNWLKKNSSSTPTAST